MSIKNFNDLIKDVYKHNICQEWEACVSFCIALENDGFGFRNLIHL